MTIRVKPLGVIERFNGVDVQQTDLYIKLSNATYINKIIQDKHLTNNSHIMNCIPHSKMMITRV